MDLWVVVGLLVDWWMMVEVGYAKATADLAQPKGGLLRPRINTLRVPDGDRSAYLELRAVDQSKTGTGSVT